MLTQLNKSFGKLVWQLLGRSNLLQSLSAQRARTPVCVDLGRVGSAPHPHEKLTGWRGRLSLGGRSRQRLS